MAMKKKVKRRSVRASSDAICWKKSERFPAAFEIELPISCVSEEQ